MMANAEKIIEQLVADKPKARRMWELLEADPEVNADWDMANYIAVSKLNYNDHGEVHAKIVAANALKMLKLLLGNGVLTSVIKEKAGDEDDAYLVVLTAALLHDIGNQVHRENHHVSGVYLAIPLLNRLSSVFLAFSLRSTRLERPMQIISLITMPMMFASNNFFPISFMPDWLQTIAHVNPLSYLTEALRQLTILPLDVSKLITDFMYLGVFATIFSSIGIITRLEILEQVT